MSQKIKNAFAGLSPERIAKDLKQGYWIFITLLFFIYMPLTALLLMWGYNAIAYHKITYFDALGIRWVLFFLWNPMRLIRWLSVKRMYKYMAATIDEGMND